jgi:hypothetical protein
LIQYLDKYPFICAKQLQYLYWRKAYLLMQNKEHLTSDGIIKILKWKLQMANIYK